VLGVHVGQIVCWEAAVAGVVAVLDRPTSVLVPVCVAATTLVGMTAIRVRGRWLHQWLGVWSRYLVRRRRPSLPVGSAGDRAAALLGHLSRGAVAGSVQVDGIEVGLVEHQGGVTALVELSPGDEPALLVEGARPVPSPAALLPLAEPGDPLVTIQVVVQVTPAPVPGADHSAPLTSYRQLTGGLVPAARRTWIALQVLRTVDDHADDDLRRSVAAAVRRLLRRLGKDGDTGRALDRTELLSVLAALAHVEPPETRPGQAGVREPAAHPRTRSGTFRGSAPSGHLGRGSTPEGAPTPGNAGLSVPVAPGTTGGPGRSRRVSRAARRGRGAAEGEPTRAPVREGWRSWSQPGLVQTSLWLRRWPDPGTPAGRDLVGQLGTIASVSTTVALAVRRHGTEVELQAVVRMAAAGPAALATATTRARDLAAEAGALLDPLRGEQAYGLAGSLPLGGFLP